MTRTIMMVLAAGMLLTACHKDKDEKEKELAAQSVLVYIAGDNNLESFIASDVRQLMQGSAELTEGNNLLMYVDRQGKLPYFMKVEKGDTVRVMTMEKESKSSNTETLKNAMKWMTDNYEAKNYGLVLWGHADGWIIHNSSKSRSGGPRHAYAQDTTNGEEWMNIPDMALALSTLPHLRFIFADCCCFQSVESAYELRNVADYIIASAAEIPGEGAPYQTVIPALFSQRDDFYQQAAAAYYEQVSYGYREPMAVVKTSEMENLAQATKTALKQSLEPISNGEGYPSVSGLIYYYDKTLFDMNDFILSITEENVYQEWKRTFDAAVPYKVMVDVWMSDGHVPYIDYNGTFFRDFEVTEERYGGVSMFVPQNSSKYLINLQNTTINQMQWYKAAGLDELGW